MSDIPDIAECTVKASYNNGQAVAEGSVLTIKPTTISLSFMRYTLANNKRKNYFVWPQRDKTTEYEVLNAPAIDDYSYKATTLRAGYIYIHYENNPNLFKEFQVDISGELTNIMSDLTEDVRKPKERRTSKYYCISNKDIVWIAYSEFQWSANYVSKIRQNKDLREKRMQKFDATQWHSNHSAPDAFTVDNIDGYYPLGDYDTPPQKQDHNGEIIWTPGDIKDSIDASKIQWWKTYYDQVEELEDLPDERDEVFFCLHDPLGCANSIGIDLEREHLYLECIVNSLQSGKNLDNLFLEKIFGYKDDSEAVDDEKQSQISALFNIARTTYQLVYGDTKMISDYDGGDVGFWNLDFKGNGISKEKVLNVLGFEERRVQKEKITELRNSFGKILTSKYYKECYKDIDIEVSQCALDGKCNLAEHMALLAMLPHANDKHLELSNTYKNFIDPWDYFFSDTIDETTEKPLNRVLDAEIEISDLYIPVVDLANKLGGLTRNLVESYAKQTIEETIKETKTITRTVEKTRVKTVQKTKMVSNTRDGVFRRLRNHKVYGENVLELQEREMRKVASSFGDEIIDYSRLDAGKYRGTKPIVRYVVSEDLVLKQKLRGKNVIQIPTLKQESYTVLEIEKYLDEIQKKVPIERQVTKPRYSNADLAQKLFDNKVFTGSLAVLQIFNTLNAYACVKKGEYKTILNAFGISAELTEASLHWFRSRAMMAGSKSTAEVLARHGKIFGNVGGAVTVLVCAWEAVNSADVNDNDSMLAWAGASGAWATFLFWGGTGLGFTPPGLIVGGIAMGLTALAYYLKDTPLEMYFKNNVLSDAVAFPLDANEKGWQYVSRIYKNRDLLIKKPNKFVGPDLVTKWCDFKVSYLDFIDILICPSIKFSVLRTANEKPKRLWSARYAIKITTSDIIEYRAEICFRQFLDKPEQLKYEAYYFEHGIGGSKEKEISVNVIDKKIVKGNGIPKLFLDFSIDPNDLENNNKNSMLLFICYLQVSDKERYPFSIDEAKRYVGVVFSTFEEIKEIESGLSKKTIKNTDFQADIKIASKDELLNKI